MSENGNPYRYVKTVDQIIAERNSARKREKEIAAAKKEKAEKTRKLNNLTKQIDEFKKQKTTLEKEISVTEANIKAAELAGDEVSVDFFIQFLNGQRNRLGKIKADERKLSTERSAIVAGLVEANKATINTTIKDSGFIKDDVKKNNKKSKIKPGEGSDIPTPPAQQTFTGYKYNLPMVRSEYFTDRSPQTKTTERGVSGSGNFSDAREMFAGTGLAKGTMQMPFNLTNSAAWKNKTGIYKNDSSMYGFKFLYNPTEVNMGWGMLESVDPNVIRSGAAGGLAPVTGVGLSTIDFTLLLNRISDMNFLDENGLAPGEDVRGPYEGINPVQRVEDLKMVYKKGTMHDLEYLFRVLNGPSAIHETILNGKSADWGFLIGTQVELFLGDGLRYLVRVNGITVNHRIFNDRMVPVLSEVSISCGRYNDVGLPTSDVRSQG